MKKLPSIHLPQKYLLALGTVLCLVVGYVCGSGIRKLMNDHSLDPIEMDVDWKHGVLPNGLTYYIRHNEAPQEKVDFYLLMKVGSLQEKDSERGLMHFLEHMHFTHTRHFKKGRMIKRAENMGLSYGQDLGGLSSIDNTEFHLKNVPVTENMDSCLLILRDWTDGLVLEEKEVEKERAVLLEEWNHQQTPFMQMYEQNLKQLYPDCLYGNRLPIGDYEVISRVSCQELQAFYRQWYRPDLQTLIVIGDIDPNEMEMKIKDLFSDIPAPSHPSAYARTTVPDNEEAIYIINQNQEGEGSSLSLIFKYDVLQDKQIGTRYEFRQNIQNNLLEQCLNYRLQEHSQTANCPYLKAVCEFSTYEISSTKNAFTLLIEPKQGQEEAALELVMEEVERVKRYGFSKTEWKRETDKLKDLLTDIVANGQVLTHGDFYQSCRKHVLLGKALPSMEHEARICLEILESLELTKANDFFKSTTQSLNRNFVVMATLPQLNDSVEMLQAAYQQAIERAHEAKLKAYMENTYQGALVNVLPKRGFIVQEEESFYGYTKWTLSNGAIVYAKPTDSEDMDIHFRAYSYGGYSAIDPEDRPMARLFNSMVPAMGLGVYGNDELAKALLDKQVGISLGLDETTEFINGSASRHDLRTLMEIIHLCFQSPKGDEKTFGKRLDLLQEETAELQKLPKQVFQDSVQRAFFKGYSWNISIDDLQSVNVKKYKELYQKRFQSASDFNFIFTGDFDEDELYDLVETYLASLPRMEVREKANLSGLPEKFTGKTEKRFTVPMTEPKTYLQLNWRKITKLNKKDVLLIDLLNMLVPQELGMLLRDEKKLEAKVDFNCSTDFLTNETLMEIYCECNPEDAAKVEKTILDGLKDLSTRGIPGKNLNQAKEMQLDLLDENVWRDEYWQDLLTEKLKDDTDRFTDLEKNLKSITAETLRLFFKNKLLDTPNMLTVVMNPQ